MKRGRPPKIRPELGSGIAPGMSLRDVEAATGVDRRFLARAKLVASIPGEEFEARVESDNPPSTRELELLARRRTGKRTDYLRRCPHCGKPLRLEDAR